MQKEESFKELSECFREFLEDRDEPEVTEIAIVASAETMEKLEETNIRFMTENRQKGAVYENIKRIRV